MQYNYITSMIIALGILYLILGVIGIIQKDVIMFLIGLIISVPCSIAWVLIWKEERDKNDA